MTARHWVYTLYGDSAPFQGQLIESVRYTIWQREVCPQSGRYHYQGYVEFRAPHRQAAVKTKIGGSPHVEPRRGSREAARAYASKEETRLPGTEPIELGNFTGGGQGARTDIQDALSILRAEPTANGLRHLYDEHGPVMVKYARGMQSALYHYSSRVGRDNPPEVFVHYGETGTGKTWTVFDRHGMSDVWRAPVSTNNVQWFDGYYGHEIALFDDFDGQHPAITVMLQVLDRYPVQIPIKGAHTHFVPTTIYITTNVEFVDWYPDASEHHKNALKRRITEFIKFSYIAETT